MIFGLLGYGFSALESSIVSYSVRVSARASMFVGNMDERAGNASTKVVWRAEKIKCDAKSQMKLFPCIVKAVRSQVDERSTKD